MKIAVNTRFLIPNKLEGIGRFSYEVLSRLVRQHPEDEFFFFFDRPFSQEFVFGPNVTPVVIGPPARHPILWYLWFEWSIPRVINRYRPDVFFSPDGYLSLRAPVKTIMVVHDAVYLHFPEDLPPMVQRYYRYYVPRFLKSAHRIVTVSDFVKNDLAGQFEIPVNKITVAHNSSENGFGPLSREQIEKIRNQYSKGLPYFLYTGAIHPRKNVDQLIRAFDQFKSIVNAPVKLLLAGRMAWKSGAVKKAYEEAKNKEDIQFLGFVPTEELTRIMGSALAFIYISKHEGFGIPLLEAMHSEVPIITSNTSSLPEVAGEAAILVNPAQTDEIIEALMAIFHDEALRLRLIDRGKIRRNQFSWNKTSDILYNCLKDAASSE